MKASNLDFNYLYCKTKYQSVFIWNVLNFLMLSQIGTNQRLFLMEAVKIISRCAVLAGNFIFILTCKIVGENFGWNTGCNFPGLVICG